MALKILAAQVVLLLICTLFGRPELYLLWIGSWMTSWRVINRLRSIAEHGGMTHSPDRRLTTHSVRQTWPARFWIVPYNTGWHLAHHVDMGVPWRNLPALHRELVASGWVTPGLEYPSYTALWRKLASREVTAPQPFPGLEHADGPASGHRRAAVGAVGSAAPGAVAESGRSQSP